MINLKDKILEIQNIINKNIIEAWEIGQVLSDEFGTKVYILPIKSDEFSIEEHIVLQVPRPCGCCSIKLKEELYPYTDNLKEIVLKMREIEKMIVDKYPEVFEIMYDISIPLGIETFLNKPVEEIFSIWEKYEYREDESNESI